MRKLVFAAVLAIAAILIGAGVTLAQDNPPGWNGDVKIHEGAGEPSPVTRDEPKVCSFHLHAFNFDSQEQVDWWIIKGEPFDTLPVLTGQTVTNTDGVFVSTVYSLSEGHYKLFWAGEQAGGAKHKVFKISCQPTPTESPSTSPSESVTPSPSSTSTPSASATETIPSATPSPSMPTSSIGSPTASTPTGPSHTLPPTDTSEQATASISPTANMLLVIGAIIGATGFILFVLEYRKPKVR
jgi:hypothetical protein